MASEKQRFKQDVADEGGFWGPLEYLSETPVLGRFLDPAGLIADKEIAMHDVSENLDPETQARLGRSVEAARSLRGRPLISEMRARQVGQEGLRTQAAAMAGASPETRYAATRHGAGMGGKILGQYGTSMAGESVERFSLGTKMAQAASQLQQGQTLFALGERLRNYLALKGVQLNEQQARNMAISAAAGFAASMGGDEKQPPQSNSGANVFRHEPTGMDAGSTAPSPGPGMAYG